MKSILIIANNDIGLYKFRKELILELIKNYKVYITLPYGNFVPSLEALGCKYIETAISRRGVNPVTDFILLLKYIKILKKLKPDIALTYTIKPNIYGGFACRATHVPYIANITGLGSAVENGGGLQKIILFLYKMALKKASCVFFQNKENEEFIIDNRIIKGKHRRIPGSGVNLEYYRLMDYPTDDQVHFLFIGRVMKEKGIDQYLETAEYIIEKYPNTVFHIIGFCEEAYEEKLKEMQGKGIIQFHGMQYDIREFQKMSHCTIHPTYYPEGMSNVLLESAACGRPVITTDRSGCREIVDDSINGFIVDQKNSRDLINKVDKFIQLDNQAKKEMGLAGRRKVENEFDRQIVISAYVEEIAKVSREQSFEL